MRKAHWSVLTATGRSSRWSAGTDYVASNFNRATTAMRQPGSSWKLFVYLAALEAGYTPEDLVVDTPPGDDQRVEPAQFQRPEHRRDGCAHRLCFFHQHGRRPAWQRGVGFGTVASMARRIRDYI